MKYCLDKPYPPIEVERENIEYAHILLEDYAGSDGEDTAIHRYFYQSIVRDEIGKILEGIARVEMHHLEILGKLIWKLGYTPSFYTIDSNIECILPWTSKYVDYSCDLETILLSDIEKEKQAIKRYRKHISEINDKYIKEILKRIIEDEEVHIECLKNIYSEFVSKHIL